MGIAILCFLTLFIISSYIHLLWYHLNTFLYFWLIYIICTLLFRIKIVQQQGLQPTAMFPEYSSARVLGVNSKRERDRWEKRVDHTWVPGPVTGDTWETWGCWTCSQAFPRSFLTGLGQPSCAPTIISQEWFCALYKELLPVWIWAGTACLLGVAQSKARMGSKEGALLDLQTHGRPSDAQVLVNKGQQSPGSMGQRNQKMVCVLLCHGHIALCVYWAPGHMCDSNDKPCFTAWRQR